MADTDATDSAESVPSAPSPDEAADSDLAADLPGDLLGDELVDPGTYEVAPDESEAEELDASDLTPDEVGDRIAPLDFEVDDEAQLVEAEAAAAKAKSSRPVRKQRPARKTVEETLADSPESAESPDEDEPKTGSKRPKRKEEVAEASGAGKKKIKKSKKKGKARRRTGPITFTRESVGELKKVVWPTGAQLRQYFVVVLLFVLFIIAYVGLLDLGFGAALLQLFGRAS